MIKQRNFQDLDINQDGCYFLCLCRMVEIEQNRPLSERLITELKNYLKNMGFIDGICRVVNPDKVFQFLGSTIRQVGKNGVYWDWVNDNQARHDFVLTRHLTDRSEHHVLRTCNDRLLFDSLEDSTDFSPHPVDEIYYTLGIRPKGRL